VDRCVTRLAATSQLRQLALAALDQQGITVRRLRWMGQHTNHLFRCDTTTGERLVLRVCLPDGRTDAELDAELIWLAELARDTDLTVPVARFSTRAPTPELPAGGRCIAFAWVQGRRCERRPSRRLVADLGRVLATLHGHAEGFRPPSGFTRPALDIQHLTWAGSSPHCTATPRASARRPVSPARPWTFST
jgi:Ser/Thr protein kinase RdoA (MazF antagonist)